ncbi:cytochrome P450 [Endogone sp. FLAS-F59071]|nr:cytochrome P450 [Endogone sp. FLAS-F59071]|eukprot:RUS16717.1 cytochrome P450 [Endogone sp. FLAS-F59071]
MLSLLLFWQVSHVLIYSRISCTSPSIGMYGKFFYGSHGFSDFHTILPLSNSYSMPPINILQMHPIATAIFIFALALWIRRTVKWRFHPLRKFPLASEPFLRVIDMIIPPKDCPRKRLVQYVQNPAYQSLVVVYETLTGPNLVVNDADLIKEIVAKRQANYNSNTVQRGSLRIRIGRIIMGRGILTTTNQDWKWRREAIVPLFQPRRVIPALLPYVIERANNLIDELSAYAKLRQAVDIDVLLVDFTFDVICKYLFGLAGDELDYTMIGNRRKIKNEFQTMMSGNQVVWIRLPYIGNTKWASRSFRPARERLESFVRQSIRRSLARPDLYLDQARSILPVVHELARHSNYSSITPGEPSQELVTELLGIIFAGHDTTSHTAAFAFGEIAKNPEVQAGLFEEVARVFGGQPGESEGIVEKLASLTYLSAVVKETQRIYPAANVIMTEAKVEQELAGHYIPAGEIILLLLLICQAIHLNIRGAMMNPRHFPNPFIFDPNRWLTSSSEAFEELDTYNTQAPSKKSLPELVFSAGAHACLGRNLAMLEIRVLLMFVINRFDIAPKEGTKLDTVFKLTLLPKEGVWLTLKDRLQDK